MQYTIYYYYSIIFLIFFSWLKSGTNIIDENTIALEIVDELEDIDFKIPDNEKTTDWVKGDYEIPDLSFPTTDFFK